MRSLLMALLVSTGLMAGDVIVGADFLYSDVKANAKIDTLSYIEDTTSLGGRLKLGYKYKDVRLSGFYQIESYQDDVILKGEGKNTTYGLNADYFIDDWYAGIIVGQGERDTNNKVVSKAKYNDFGIRTGLTVEYLEVGIDYRKRDYKDVFSDGIMFKEEDRLIGFYIGFNFNI